MTQETLPADLFAVACASWMRSKPVPTDGGTEVFAAAPVGDPAAATAELRAVLLAGAAARPAAVEAVERVLSIAGELTVNAVEHARPPVALRVADDGRRWVVTVTDGAPDRAPTPRREPAAGVGLGLVDELADEHGTQYEHEHKLVWASVLKPV